jgi:hypothetical protein
MGPDSSKEELMLVVQEEILEGLMHCIRQTPTDWPYMARIPVASFLAAASSRNEFS